MIDNPKVIVVGGPDVDARLQIMNCLNGSFQFSALGSEPSIQTRFITQGYEYDSYRLSRNLSPLHDCRTVAQMVKVFRRRKPQIVHCFDTKPGIWGCLAARMAGVPGVVGTVTGLGSLYGRKELKPRMAWKAYCRLQAMACRASNVTVFQNHDDADYFLANRIAAQDKTKIILGSGVSTNRFSRSKFSIDDVAKIRKDLGLDQKAIVVTMISRVMHSKGLPEFLETARVVRKRHPNVRFLLIGAEDKESLDRPSQDELAELRRNVIWPGPRRDIPAVLAASDVFVLPTAYREGLPRVLLEAASMGLPLIATDAAGCREIVQHEINGFLVPIGDTPALANATMRLVEQPQLRHRFGKASRQLAVAHFDVAVIAAQTKSIYQQMLAANSVERIGGPLSVERRLNL